MILAATVALAGCSEGADPAADATHRIEIEHVGSLDDDEGPGGLQGGGHANLTLLDDGRLIFWDQFQPTRIRIYNAGLELDTVFGRAGEGPGEFQRARFHGVIGDTLFVYQELVGRLELFDKDDLTHLDTRLGGLGNPSYLLFSPEGYIVGSSMEMSPEGIGLPVREMATSGEVRAAFGAEFPVVMGDRIRFYYRKLAFAPDGSLWVLPEFEPRVERWRRTNGDEPTWDMDTSFVIPDLEFPATSEEYVGYSRSASEPPSTMLSDVDHQPDGPVWVIAAVPHPEWENRIWTEDRYQELNSAPANTQRVTRIHAFDPDSGTLLASRTLDELWGTFIGQGVAYSWDLDEFGIPYVDLWRPRLVTEPAES